MVFSFLSPSPPPFFLRNGILKQPATKANSPDNSLNNLHNARVEEDTRQSVLLNCVTRYKLGNLG